MPSTRIAQIALLFAVAFGAVRPAVAAAGATQGASQPATPSPADDLESRRVGAGPADQGSATTLDDWLAIGAALALVAGVLVGVAWLVRKLTQRNGIGGKNPLLDVLAVKAISSKERLVLVRMGGRLVLVGSGPGGPRKLSEISDGEEVRQAQRQASGAGNWRADTSPEAQNGGRP